MIKSSGESGANFDDSLTGGGVVSFDYKYSDTLKMGLIVGIRGQLLF